MSFWVNRCGFPLSDLLRVFLVLLSYYLSIQFFRNVFFFGCHILVQNLLRPVVSMFSCHLLPVVDRIFFRWLGMSCFCLYYSTLCRYLFHLPSFTSNFWLISSSCIVFFFSSCLSFLSLHIPCLSFYHLSSFLCFIILTCFRRFFYLRFSRISHPGFDFFFVLLRESQFSHKLISLPHRLVHLIQLYHSLIYMSVFDSLCNTSHFAFQWAFWLILAY